MNDPTLARLRALATALLRQAEAEEALARRLLAERSRAVKDLEALVAGWAREDEPDGPLFGRLTLTSPVVGTIAGPLPEPPKRQDQRGTVEVVKQWTAYHKHTLAEVGAVDATTEPAALALAIDRWGPDVLVRPAGGPQPSPGPSPDPHPSWAEPADFTVTLADGQTVRVVWDPAHTWANGVHEGEPGCLSLSGPVSAEGFRGMGVAPHFRTQPLEQVAGDWARHHAGQEAARRQLDAEAAGRPKQPRKRKAAKGEAAKEEGADA